MAPPAEATAGQPVPESLEDKVRHLESRVENLETVVVKLCSIEERLDGTPALGLKHRFKCDCGASGFVALHVQCTKCGRETGWGWFPKEQ